MDRRKEILYEPPFGRGFYDSEVQKVLCLRRTINDQDELDLETRQFHLAWPLEVFSTVSHFADRCENDNNPWKIREHHTQVIDWYRRDPLFTARLLLVVTQFEKTHPRFPLDTPNYKATLREAMLASQSWGDNQIDPIFIEVIESPVTPADIDKYEVSHDVYDWKTIANLLETHHLKLGEKSKKKKTALHNLLRIYFNKEKKRRARIDKLWAPNTEAKFLLRETSPEVFAKNSYWPDLDFYPQTSVTPKIKT